jgi:hypothetical protein
MRRKLVTPALLSSVVVAALLLCNPTGAAAFHEATIHLEAGGWFPSLDAKARSSSFGVSGNLVSNDEIGLDDPDVVIVGSATLRLAQRHTLRAEAFGFSVDGSKRINQSFTFDGKIYPIGTQVDSEADVLFGGADYGFDLVHNEIIAIGLTLGVRAVSAKATIEAPQLNQKGEGELQAALPAIGIVGILHPFPVPILKSLALSARLSGGTIGDAGSFIDVDGGIEWLPIPVLALRIGYRYFHAEGENDGDEAEVDLSGPYASVTLTF